MQKKAKEPHADFRTFSDLRSFGRGVDNPKSLGPKPSKYESLEP